MPELAEAETIRRQLVPVLRGKSFCAVELSRKSMLRHPKAKEFLRCLQGRRIVRLIRRGKAIIFILENDSSLIIRLGMSGTLGMAPAEAPADKHVALRATFEGVEDELRFRDPRRFGSITLRCGTDPDQFPEFAHYGPEPLSKEFTADYVARVLKGRKAMIGVLLMDQRLFCGVGKIYADEIAFRAGIRPTRRGRFTRAEIQRIAEQTREVLQEAIRQCGTTAGDSTYRDARGRMGRFQPSTYFRTGEPCLVCGTPIRRTNLTGGRGLHWCPICQK